MSTRKTIPTNGLPAYWTILSDSDKRGYLELQRTLDPLTLRTDKDQLASRFQLILSTIHRFAIRQDDGDWRRCLVCGIAWIGGDIALNTRQLALLIRKCKSSINAGVEAVGYATVPTTSDNATLLIRFFPFLLRNCTEMRQWTIRAQPDRLDASPPERIAKGAIDEIEDLILGSSQEFQLLDWRDVENELPFF
jgi:hypothetical protein